MGKINGMRVFLGGLLAGVVFSVLGYIGFVLYGNKLWEPALKALGLQVPASAGMYIWMFASSFIMGILAVWLYAAIRPRYGAGAKTAVCAGLTVWAFSSLLPNASIVAMGLFPANLMLCDSLTSLVTIVVGTFLGAWIYTEGSQ